MVYLRSQLWEVQDSATIFEFPLLPFVSLYGSKGAGDGEERSVEVLNRPHESDRGNAINGSFRVKSFHRPFLRFRLYLHCKCFREESWGVFFVWLLLLHMEDERTWLFEGKSAQPCLIGAVWPRHICEKGSNRHRIRPLSEFLLLCYDVYERLVVRTVCMISHHIYEATYGWGLAHICQGNIQKTFYSYPRKHIHWKLQRCHT